MRRNRNTSVLSFRRGDKRALKLNKPLRVEPLEDRRLLALLGVSPSFPLTTYDSTGHIAYIAATQDFDLTAQPLRFKETASSPQRLVNPPRSLEIHIKVDNAGNLIGGVPGPDFTMSGTIDINGDTIPDVTGVLLTGEISAFGYDASNAPTGLFDFQLTVTGGALASYFAGQDIGVTCTSEASTFTDFTTDFTGGAKGSIGPVPTQTQVPSTLAWEKRDTAGNLLGGATFTVTPDPSTGSGSLTIADNDANDADPNSGAFQVTNVMPGTYTVTETVAPTGYALDPTPSRTITVDPGMDASIGTPGSDDPGETNTSDFHDPLGSIAWEKRDTAGNLQGGATFSITPDPTTGSGSLTVVDNGAGDANPAPGQILVNNAFLGTYTITETVAPPGYAIDPNPSRSVTVSDANLNAVVGTQGSDDPSDFHDPLGSISWEKRRADTNALQGSATFTVTPNPNTGSGTLTVVDNGANDTDPAAGQITVAGVLLGSYTVTETVAPAGFAIDPTPSRSVTVSQANQNASIGTAGTNDSSDFHDPLGSISWEKRRADTNALQGGATFTVTPNPNTGSGTLTVVDNGANDTDPAAGQITVAGVLLGSYTVTETVAPAGFAIDPTPSRSVTVSQANQNASIGTAGTNDSSDFHDPLGSISWEKRRADTNALQGGATFTVTPNPNTGSGTLTVVDNGANDTDPAAGQITVAGVLLGSYTVTETVAPAGFAIDPTPSRSVTVSQANQNASIGTAGTNDSSDFHDPLGSISWEKRRADTNALQGGATFTVTPNPNTGSGTLTVVDNGANDTDPAAGQITVAGVLLGSYTVTETVAPAGFAIDPTPSRSVTVSQANQNASIGTAGTNDSSDFHDPLGSISWEKRRADTNALQGGATFTVTPNPNTGSGTLTVVDNGANDTDPAAGQITVAGVLLGSYTVTETVAPAGFAIDPTPSRSVTVSQANQNASIGTAGTNDSSDFHDPLGSISWEKRRADTNALQGGATFTVTPNPNTGSGTLTVVDNGANDTDPAAGQITVAGVLLGSYTVTETVAPAGFAIDPTPSRSVTVSQANQNASIGTAGTNDSSDFHDPLGSISWEKRRADTNALQGGATFTVTPNPNTGSGTLTVVDNGANDTNPVAGQITVAGALLGSYTITETVAPSGFSIDPNPSRSITVSQANQNAVLGTQGANDSCDFHDPVATGSISGTKYDDTTGNGFSNDDTPMSGVKVYLDANNNGVFDTGEASMLTDANGNYSFTGLMPGTYNVREVVPSGFVRTGPALSDHYTVVVTSGSSSTGNDFDNAEMCDKSVLTSFTFIINGTTQVSDLRGNTHQGDIVDVVFTVSSTVTVPHQFTLVSYTAPGAAFDANTASQQQIFDQDTGFFGPGTYTLEVIIPNSFYQIDFVCGPAIDMLGPAGSNIFYSAQNRLFSADNGGVCPPLANDGTLSGVVYNDANCNGQIDPTERAVGGATVTLTGTNDLGQVINYVTHSGDDGTYLFSNLRKGTYKITETQPVGYNDGIETLGSLGGTKGTDNFSNIKLYAGQNGVNYNFGETATAATLHAGQTATTAFWYSTSGQNLIKAMNGSSTAKSLSNWLVTNFPNIYGAYAGTSNLTGKTNGQVAAFFQSLFTTTSKALDAQVLATALAVYSTNSSLAGSTVATGYGFIVNSTGTGSAVFNLGTNGFAFGVADYSVITIMQILQSTNAKAHNGILWDTDSSGAISSAEDLLRALGNIVFTAINTNGTDLQLAG